VKQELKIFFSSRDLSQLHNELGNMERAGEIADQALDIVRDQAQRDGLLAVSG
jgi:hypothetical protein